MKYKAEILKAGVGMLNDNNTISNYELITVDLYDKPPYDDSEPLKIVGDKDD